MAETLSELIENKVTEINQKVREKMVCPDCLLLHAELQRVRMDKEKLLGALRDAMNNQCGCNTLADYTCQRCTILNVIREIEAD